MLKNFGPYCAKTEKQNHVTSTESNDFALCVRAMWFGDVIIYVNETDVYKGVKNKHTSRCLTYIQWFVFDLKRIKIELVRQRHYYNASESYNIAKLTFGIPLAFDKK